MSWRFRKGQLTSAIPHGVALVVSVTLAACGGASASGPVEVRLVGGANETAHIEVVNLPQAVARELGARERSRDEWASVMRVSVAEGQPAMLGDYEVRGQTLRFTPAFPFDPGRRYQVVFAAGDARASATVGLPAVARNPTTTVTHVFPSSATVPENQLRLYIHFAAPMGRAGGLDHITLLDDRGEKVVDPFLPLDAEFWNDDRTRYTVFFDPGRQKRGILPNQQMGRSLEPGKRYTLVVSREWRDGGGLPLADDYRREFLVGPADERPLDTTTWQIDPPAAGSRDPLVVRFKEPLDHGLLLRALGVTADGKFLDGEVAVAEGETRWSFVPRAPWLARVYQLTALSMLEDLAGNRIGRAFEVDRFDRSDASPEPERTHIPFTVR
jgi:hypothetical protein